MNSIGARLNHRIRIALQKAGLARCRTKGYWYIGQRNFGDLLTKPILYHYGIPVDWSPAKDADIASTGSILHHLPEDFSGIIAGSGLIEPANLRFPNARIVSLRGALTRSAICAPPATAMGDPGLLLSKVYPRPAEPRHALGIIPHYTDIGHAALAKLLRDKSPDVLLIDPRRSPHFIVDDILRCSRIASSSLHGLIVADSYGIPNAWLHIGTRIIGGNFKYYDYWSGTGASPKKPLSLSEEPSISEIVSACTEDRRIICSAVQRLDTMFSQLGNELSAANE